MTDASPLLFLSSHAPWTSSAPSACLDALMTAAVFDQPVVLVLHGEGVYQLLRGQQSDAQQTRALAGKFGALGLYGIKHILVEEGSLQARGLDMDDLLDGSDSEDPAEPLRPALVSAQELAGLISSARAVFTF